MAQDYIMRLVEQIALMLARLARLRSAQKPAYLSAISLGETGLPFDLVKHSSPEQIVKLLETGGATQYARAVVLAELLLQDAELSEAAGKNRESVISRVQAHALLEHSIKHLATDEQAVYRPKLEALAALLRRDPGQNKGSQTAAAE